MSESYEHSEGETADRRLIREAKEEAWHARRRLRRELPNPSVAAKHDLACALDDYRDLLYDYQGERVLDTPWDERPVDVDDLDRLLNETTTTTETLNRRGNPTEKRTVQLVAEVSPHRLFQIAKELDAIAKELGFAAEAKRSREMYHIANPDDQDHPEPVSENVPKPGQHE